MSTYSWFMKVLGKKIQDSNIVCLAATKYDRLLKHDAVQAIGGYVTWENKVLIQLDTDSEDNSRDLRHALVREFGVYERRLSGEHVVWRPTDENLTVKIALVCWKPRAGCTITKIPDGEPIQPYRYEMSCQNGGDEG